MTHDEFSQLLGEIVNDMERTMASKNHEYAPGKDKLANFKKSARSLGVTPQQCLWYFCQKHLTSVQDIVNGETAYSNELLREKCGDIRNYTVLLEALMLEEHSESSNQ